MKATKYLCDGPETVHFGQGGLAKALPNPSLLETENLSLFVSLCAAVWIYLKMKN